MRWTVEGAQAMLHVRALYLNDQCKDFIEFRAEREQTRLYDQLRPSGRRVTPNSDGLAIHPESFQHPSDEEFETPNFANH